MDIIKVLNRILNPERSLSTSSGSTLQGTINQGTEAGDQKIFSRILTHPCE